MTTVLTPEQFLEHVEEVVETAKDEEMVFLLGDLVASYSISATDSGKYSQFKRIGPVGYLKEAFETEGSQDLMTANSVLFGTVAIGEEHISEEAQSVLDEVIEDEGQDDE